MMLISSVDEVLTLKHKHASLRRALKKRSHESLMNLPIGTWLTTSDRGVPHEYVGRRVSELLAVDFESLARARGIGIVKIRKLIDLLDRVSTTNRADHPGLYAACSSRDVRASRSNDRDAAWNKNVDLITEAGLTELSLGRLTAVLSEMPRRLWHLPISQFTQLSYEQLRAIPYLGPRRVASIIRLASDTAERIRTRSEPASGEGAWLAPSIGEADRWIRSRLLFTDRPSAEVVYQGLVRPLLRQIEIDLGPRATTAARQALGHRMPELDLPTILGDVEATAFSKSRNHQIKELIRNAMRVRWPDGERLLEAFQDHRSRFSLNPGQDPLVAEISGFFFGKRRLVGDEHVSSGCPPSVPSG